jgi:hypothetical protein
VCLSAGLKAAQLTADDIHFLKGSDPRKLLLADLLWRRTTVSQEWLAVAWPCAARECQPAVAPA